MSVLDKKYLIELDILKNTENPTMIFSISDKDTSDFYTKIYRNGTLLDLANYKVTLWVVKANKATLSKELTEIDTVTKAIYCNLDDDFKNVKGKCKAQIILQDEETGEKIATVSQFEYRVNSDIESEQNNVEIEDTTVLTQILERITALETYGTGGGASIDDTTTALNKTWSSDKIDTQLKNIANNQPTDLSLDSATNLLQLINSNGSKLGNGITLPISSGGGTNQYLHIKYSTTGAPQLAGQISDTPNAYIGLCVDTNADAPINPRSYTWYKWKGEDGAKGDTGATPQFTIGEVTTLDSGSNATASITGTTENPVLNLGIPKGDGTDGSSENEWRLIRDITLEEDVAVIDINIDEEGNSFKLTEYILQFYGCGDQASNTFLSLGYKSGDDRTRYYCNTTGLSSNGTNRYSLMYCKSIGTSIFTIGSLCNSNPSFYNALIPNTIKPENRTLIGFTGVIDNISMFTDMSLSKKICAGSNIKIYGR